MLTVEDRDKLSGAVEPMDANIEATAAAANRILRPRLVGVGRRKLCALKHCRRKPRMGLERQGINLSEAILIRPLV